MKPILHIVKNSNDTQAIGVIEKQAKDNAYGVTAVFIQDASPPPSLPNVRTCILEEDARSKAISSEVNPSIEPIRFDDMLNLIFSVESITVW
jgi:hypothetical protein